jgi:hypothetical protein
MYDETALRATHAELLSVVGMCPRVLSWGAAAELKSAGCFTESELAVKSRPKASKHQPLGHVGPALTKVGTSECGPKPVISRSLDRQCPLGDHAR